MAPDFPFSDTFKVDDFPWNWVSCIKKALSSPAFVPNESGASSLPQGVVIEGAVYLAPDVVLGPNVYIEGPAYIGGGTKIRPGAFIRGNVIVGKGCVLGNSSEFKNCLLLDGVQVPHFNYVGDSVLGNRTHLGAGVICSNLRLDQQNVLMKLPAGVVDSGLRKLGALVGDDSEVGCNSVLNPGVIIGKRSLVYPSMSFDGVLDSDSIAAIKQSIRIFKRR